MGICTLAYILSFVDRQILSLLIAPIQSDLGISDTAFSILHGFAFSLFYATMGIPVATLSDRTSRPLVISVGMAIWSVATVACGLANSFVSLFAARVMIGAGEAALSPASHALINDLFPRDRLGRALGIYSLGSFLGAGLAFLTGGAVIAFVAGQHSLVLGGLMLKPWQACFVIVGLPGLALALLVMLTVRDPRRPSGTGVARPGFRAVLAMLKQRRAIFIPHMAGYALSGWALFGFLAWGPATLTRGFGLDMARAGLWLGGIAIFAGGGGALASGWLLDRFTRAGRGDAALLVGMVGGGGTALFALMLGIYPASAGVGAALAILAGLQFFSSFPIAPSGALVQLVAPAGMRARVSALLICCTSMMGAGVGTLLIGLCNDHLFGTGAGITASLALVCGTGGTASAALLALGCAPMRRFLNGQDGDAA